MNSTKIQQEIELLNNQLTALSSSERTPVKTAAEAIEQAQIVAQKEAKKGVLNTALSQLQSQLEEALRVEDMQRQSENLRKCEAFDVEAEERLKIIAAKFNEADELLIEFMDWSKKFHPLFCETFNGTSQNPCRINVSNNNWDAVLGPKRFDAYDDSIWGMTVGRLNFLDKK